MYSANILWRNSIFTRLVIVFLLVMITFYILGIQIFSWSKDMLSREIFNSMQSQVTFYLNNLDSDIQRIKELEYDCFNDEDLNQLAYAAGFMSDFEKTKAILRLQQRITSIKSSSVYIRNVSIYIPSISRIIYPKGTIRGSIADMTEEAYAKLRNWNASLSSDSQLVLFENSLYLNVPLNFQYSLSDPEPFFIMIEFSNEALKSTLLQTNKLNGVKSMLVNSAQGFVITSEDDEKTSKKFQQLLSAYMEKKSDGAIPTEVNGERYLLFYASSKYSGMILSRYIPEEIVFKPLKKYQLWFWAFSILAIIIIAMYSLSIYRFIQKPLRKLVIAFKKVEIGNLDFVIQSEHKDEFKYIYTRFNVMLENLKTLLDQVYKQKILAQKAELKQLQSQIKPHFLYNSFFILQRRISKGDYENAEKFCEGLGTYFKFITRSEADEVSLENEVEHARTYAEIQATRFSNRISVDFGNMPDDCKNVVVPRLIMQPLVENAFEHGLEDKEEDGLLIVQFQKFERTLKITIEDNGDHLSEDELIKLQSVLNHNKEGFENTGVINIHKRIRLAMGANSGLQALRSELGGLKIEIILNFESATL